MVAHKWITLDQPKKKLDVFAFLLPRFLSQKLGFIASVRICHDPLAELISDPLAELISDPLVIH